MLVYFLFRIAIIIVRWIPFSILYLLSDILAFLLYRIFAYRKKVIRKNLTNAFPDRSPVQLKSILKKTYTNLSDVLLEGIKGFSAKEKDLIARYHFSNPDLVTSFFEKGQSAIGLVAHYNNWEWGAYATAQQIKGPVIGVSKVVKNPYIDRFIKKNRARFGSKIIHTQETLRSLVQHKDTPGLYVLIADQSPASAKHAHWLRFLNQDTACHSGPDKIAQRTDYPAIYFDVQRRKRGFYTIEAILLHPKPAQLAPEQLTQRYMQQLEKIIRQQPENWLWSHRRWKKKRKN